MGQAHAHHGERYQPWGDEAEEMHWGEELGENHWWGAVGQMHWGGEHWGG